MIDNLMAMLIFAAGSAAVVTGINQQIRLNQGGAELVAGTTIARNVFEDLRRRDPEEYLTTGMPNGVMGPLSAAGVPSPSGKYFVKWDYTGDNPIEGVNTVTITVYWRNLNDEREQISFISAVRAPRNKPQGIILPWAGYTPKMMNWGDCEEVPGESEEPTPPPEGASTPVPTPVPQSTPAPGGGAPPPDAGGGDGSSGGGAAPTPDPTPFPDPTPTPVPSGNGKGKGRNK